MGNNGDVNVPCEILEPCKTIGRLGCLWRERETEAERETERQRQRRREHRSIKQENEQIPRNGGVHKDMDRDGGKRGEEINDTWISRERDLSATETLSKVLKVEMVEGSTDRGRRAGRGLGHVALFVLWVLGQISLHGVCSAHLLMST